MNDIDKYILEKLYEDARISHTQLAEEVGLSRPAVAERIKKLEQKNIIKGYSAVLNPEALGQSITAFISGRHQGIANAKTFDALRSLAKQKDILEIHSIAGEDCFLIKVRTSDMTSLNNIVNNLKKTPLKMSTKTTIVLESYFEKVGGTVLMFDK